MYLQVESEQGDIRKFSIIREVDDFHDVNIYVGDVQSRSGACVHIIIDKSKTYATLENVVYRASCDIHNKLEAHKGTIWMLQGTLQYICKKYPSLEFISLNDKSTIPQGNIHVTAKRLLQGRPGWYQEQLQAVPDMNDKPTRRLMKKLKHPDTQAEIQKYLPRTTQRSWGTSKDILELAPLILGDVKKDLLGTAWKIMRQDILLYPVRVSHHASRSQHGSGTLSLEKLHTRSLQRQLELMQLWHDLQRTT